MNLMRRASTLTLFILLICFSAFGADPIGLYKIDSGKLSPSIQDSLSLISPSVVRLQINLTIKEHTRVSQATGFIISPGNRLVTAFHNIEGGISDEATSAKMKIYIPGRRAPIVIDFWDAQTRAGLKIFQAADAVLIPLPEKFKNYLSPISEASSLGDKVAVLGYPHASSAQKVSVGHVLGFEYPLFQQIVTTAVSLTGMSGAPLVVLDADNTVKGVFGVNTGSLARIFGHTGNLLPSHIEHPYYHLMNVLNIWFWGLTYDPDPVKYYEIVADTHGTVSSRALEALVKTHRTEVPAFNAVTDSLHPERLKILLRLANENFEQEQINHIRSIKNDLKKRLAEIKERADDQNPEMKARAARALIHANQKMLVVMQYSLKFPPFINLPLRSFESFSRFALESDIPTLTHAMSDLIDELGQSETDMNEAFAAYRAKLNRMFSAAALAETLLKSDKSLTERIHYLNSEAFLNEHYHYLLSRSLRLPKID